MFFTLSKLFWFVFSPTNLVFIALCLAALLSFARRPVWSIRLLRLTMAVVVFFAVVPIGRLMVGELENRFPANIALPKTVDGIVILGGVINPALSAARGAPQINDSIERVIAGADLARRYPDARVIFSGGSGDPFNPQRREAHYAPKLFEQLGLPPDRVVYEDRARNTSENAKYSMEVAKPKAGETWLLVTSAFHMPRSVGVFRKRGWRVVPYPVDFNTTGSDSFELSFNINGVNRFSGALHEYIGLTAYWLTGRTDSWFPGPET